MAMTWTNASWGSDQSTTKPPVGPPAQPKSSLKVMPHTPLAKYAVNPVPTPPAVKPVPPAPAPQVDASPTGFPRFDLMPQVAMPNPMDNLHLPTRLSPAQSRAQNPNNDVSTAQVAQPEPQVNFAQSQNQPYSWLMNPQQNQQDPATQAGANPLPSEPLDPNRPSVIAGADALPDNTAIPAGDPLGTQVGNTGVYRNGNSYSNIGSDGQQTAASLAAAQTNNAMPEGYSGAKDAYGNWKSPLVEKWEKLDKLGYDPMQPNRTQLGNGQGLNMQAIDTLRAQHPVDGISQAMGSAALNGNKDMQNAVAPRPMAPPQLGLR